MDFALTASGWFVVGVLVTYIKFRKPEKVIETVIEEKVTIEPEIPADLHELAKIAEPIVEKLDKETQSGEWKFHQAFAAMTKNKAAKGVDRWKLGFAIHLALAERRMNGN